MAKISNLQGERWVTSREKRRMDIALALTALPVAVPIGGLALGASRLIDGRGAWFTQQRLGLDDEMFTLAKVRTMKGADGGPAMGRPDEVTTLGALLRPVGIDEIPQLINILDGSMSVVGPRPHPLKSQRQMETDLDKDLLQEWSHVRRVSRPGLFSAYSLMLRSRPELVFNPDSTLKAESDINDFYSASLKRDAEIIRQAVGVCLRAHSEQAVSENGAAFSGEA